MAIGIEQVARRRLPEQFHDAVVEELAERRAELSGLRAQAVGRLVEAEHEARFLRRGPRQEVQPHRRLAGAGRAHQHRGRRRRQAAAEHGVEVLDAGRNPAERWLAAAAGLGVQGFDARIDDEAVIRDLVGMATAQEAAAAELGDLEIAFGLPAVDPVVEHDQPVDHRLLG